MSSTHYVAQYLAFARPVQAVFGLGAAALTALLTVPLRAWLRSRQLGKTIREDGPDHASKAGTPTMGGLALIAVLVLGLGLLWFEGNPLPTAPALLAALIGFGALGLLDDWAGLARKGRAREIGVGWTARRMIVAQTAVAIGVAWLLRDQYAPWTAGPPAEARWAPWAVWSPGVFVAEYGTVAWLALATLVLIATVNGVNLSDGLDGLAAGLVALAFTAIGLILPLRLNDVAVNSGLVGGTLVWPWIVVGACIGFLIHNRHPATVFMGNVASMALGGALATFALATGLWPILPVVGAVFVIEVLSVVIQVGYYKISGGERVFRMAPIHHHFELGGWPERRIVRRFWLAGLAAALLGVGLSLLGSP